MEVICIKERNLVSTQIKKGEFYRIDRNSIWIDSDGDVYGQVYSENGKYIGQMLLSHFQTV